MTDTKDKNDSNPYLCLWVIVIPLLLIVILQTSGFFDWLDSL